MVSKGDEEEQRRESVLGLIGFWREFFEKDRDVFGNIYQMYRKAEQLGLRVPP